MGEKAGKIFISYAREDASAAAEITDALEAVGLAAWVDRKEISPGDSFLERMQEGLAEASYVLFLVSNASLSSRWVSREWMAALNDDETVLLPLLLEPVQLPPLIRDIVYIDLSQDRAAGIRELVAFLRRETEPATVARRSVGGEGRVSLRGASRRELRLIATRCIDESAFAAFLFDVEIEPGSIAGDSLHQRIVQLLHRVANEGDLERLADWLASEKSVSRCVTSQLQKIRSEDTSFRL